jgi:hypothetical protein
MDGDGGTPTHSGVVLREFVAKPPSFHSNDRIDARVVRGIPIEHLDRNHGFFDLIAVTSELLLDYVLEESNQPFGRAETWVCDDAFKLRTNGIGGDGVRPGSASRLPFGSRNPKDSFGAPALLATCPREH